MTHLGMLDAAAAVAASDSSSMFSCPPTASDNVDLPPVDYKSIKLNLVRHLCESPNILCSNLSKNALRLLHSGEMSDMEFEVIASSPFPSHRSSVFLVHQLPKVHIFRAHRAIVCSRCEYFRRALLSGMKEDIDRRIIVQDTSPVIFRRFLLYLYGGPIDRTVSADQICELMLLGDRYSLDELKDSCEQILKAQIDEESVICLLSIADRFNAVTLKSNCLAFISNRMHLIKQELFMELSARLKEEVYELIQWTNRTKNWHTSSGGATKQATEGERTTAAVFEGGGVGGGSNNSPGQRLHVTAAEESSAASSATANRGGGGGSGSARSPNRTNAAAAAKATATTSPFM